MAKLYSDFGVLGKLMPGCFVGPVKCAQPAASFLPGCREACLAQIGFASFRESRCLRPIRKAVGHVEAKIERERRSTDFRSAVDELAQVR